MFRTFLSLALFAVLAVTGPVAAAAPQTATFAGGCFWCIESDFDKVPGVISTTSGYTGGHTADPDYGQVTAGGTGHREALQIRFDPEKVSYSKLLEVFWHSVDPTDPDGQFCDRGVSYQTAIFVHDEQQRQLAEASKGAAMASLGRKIVTPVETAGRFFPAEEYHQDYYQKNPLRYRFYRWNCGRNQRVKEVWGDKAYTGISGKH